ncbi:MAG TPA: tRNA uridine-5-carboxymethylaminomethyl(34) synthesis GTPase MnmE [Thermoanaerobaculia bacterium]|nr:tRNA uridine-5-carboxymethylaminomethyl(34) synthesis GTPase MnmE [Thermoanaerobaculia bacterium]
MTAEPIETIVAPATPVGRSALAIVRIDGPAAAAILQSLTPSQPLAEPRVAAFRRIVIAGELLDECVVVRYASPHSYTGNDLVEITLHGNPLLITRLLRAVIDLGARAAEAGELTERAVLNGKIDLVQAESVASLIAARTPLQAKLSLTNLEGMLSRTASAIRDALLQVIARLEAALDFSEEGYDFISREETREKLEGAVAEVRRLVETYRRGRATTEGLTAVILGRPNAGKSTLLNRLVGTDRAIVTPIPGTTRDILRETIEIGGLPVTIADTAGLRASSDVIEGIGIDRARNAALRADLVLYLIDAEEGESEMDRLELAQLVERDVIVVYAKSDLADPPVGELGISVRDERGIDTLLSLLDERVRERYAIPESSSAIVNERQREAVASCEEALVASLAALGDGLDEQMILVDLYRAANSLGLLTGAITRDEILAEIFSKFCIGK